MILGIGVDVVEVERFKTWVDYPLQQLLRIFSQSELDSIFNVETELRIQRMASRFAAKEAFYKALSATLVKLGKTRKKIHFIATCKAIKVKTIQWEIPTIDVNWKFFEERLEIKFPKFEINLSLSHEKNYSVAYVIIQEQTDIRTNKCVSV